MTSYRINFIKSVLLNISLPAKGKRDYYYDLKEAGLILDVTSTGSKSFYLYRRINSKPERILLGAFPDLTIEQARKLALQKKGEIAFGINPKDKIKSLKQEITFGIMFEEFMERYSKKNKRTWKEDQREVSRFLSHWFKRKSSSITKQEIQILLEKIRDENGLYQANRLFERIRAIYNKHIEWGWKGINPCNGIKKFKEKSRERFLHGDELPNFFEALNNEPNETLRDFFYTCLLTGARRGNVLSMNWKDINLERGTWNIKETKNGEGQIVPLSAEVITILERRLTNKISDWVFTSASSASGHLEEPKKAWRRILQNAGIEDLRIHDLRRTLGSWQAATGANSFVIGKSLGHKTQSATAIYARLNLDPVRESVSKATSAMFSAALKK
jgi:integrase